MAHEVKVSEATGLVLDWMVAKALGHNLKLHNWESIIASLDSVMDADIIAFHAARKTVRVFAEQIPGSGWFSNPRYSDTWSHGGPIVDRLMLQEGLVLRCWVERGQCQASLDFPHKFSNGPTPLIAAMRCFAASKLGDLVKLPDEFHHA